MIQNKIKIFGALQEDAYKQILMCAEKGEYGVLCADHHIGYSMPIGGVVAYKNYISPSGVGFDIACGNKAVMTDAEAVDIKIKNIMDEIFKKIGFGLGRPNPEPVEHPVLENIAKSELPYIRKMLPLAQQQLGTVGSGNHYVDLFKDEEGKLWIGVHFGSRGFGHKIAMGFLALARNMKFDDKPKDANNMFSPPTLLKVDSEIGQDYIYSMRLAGEYAYAGRDEVIKKVLRILGVKSVYEVHNHHNFAWKEKHFGEILWVIRKVCTPAFPDQSSFIGSTMADESVIVQGVESKESREALYSTVHGAGRIMSRMKAAGKMKWKRGKKGEHYPVRITGGLINFKDVRKMMAAKKIELRGGGADESPDCYKNLDDVLKYHKNTLNIIHRLKPIGVAMAGEDVYDPYKD